MDQEFPDLLWKNGNGSTPRKLQSRSNEAKQDPKPDLLNSSSNHPSAVMDDEISSLFQYPPYYDYLEKEFGCDFLCEFSNPHAITTDKQNKSINNESSSTASFNVSAQQYAEFPQKKVYKEGGESSSMRTAISCLSLRNYKKELEASFPSEMAQNETFEATGTSSSGGSGVSFRAAPKEVKNQFYKRKGRDVEESCSLSEEGDYESLYGKKPAQRSRRSRAAEVHNLSERKRRDRINEKMKALQDLIPHCTKSDKASMLDEAIEYLKSLQQQVQIMWMGSGMATMMFPTVPNLMAHMSMGIGRAPMPALSDLLQLQRVPLINQGMPSAMPANPVAVCPKFPLQMPESFTQHIGFHHHVQASPQAMSLYGYGSQMAQQNQMAAVSRSSSLPKTEESAPESLHNGK